MLYLTKKCYIIMSFSFNKMVGLFRTPLSIYFSFLYHSLVMHGGIDTHAFVPKVLNKRKVMFGTADQIIKNKCYFFATTLLIKYFYPDVKLNLVFIRSSWGHSLE